MKGYIQTIFIGFIIITGAVTATLQANHMDEDTIDQRTRPVGQVNIEGMPKTSEMANEEAVIAAEEVVEVQVSATGTTTSASGRSGDALYNSFCIACHSIGLANAPKAGDSAAWDKLLEIGMDELVASAKKGKNVMPPMGTCADCSDDELKDAIEFMRTMKP